MQRKNTMKFTVKLFLAALCAAFIPAHAGDKDNINAPVYLKEIGPNEVVGPPCMPRLESVDRARITPPQSRQQIQVKTKNQNPSVNTVQKDGKNAAVAPMFLNDVSPDKAVGPSCTPRLEGVDRARITAPDRIQQKR